MLHILKAPGEETCVVQWKRVTIVTGGETDLNSDMDINIGNIDYQDELLPWQILEIGKRWKQKISKQ